MTTAAITELTELARQRQAELDAAIVAWRKAEGSRTRLWCGPGCGNCCTLTVNATLPEALAIAGRLDDVLRPPLARTVAGILHHGRQCDTARAFLAGYRQAVGFCPFLDADANCAIYDHRPLACRALLATRPADWCGVNLAELATVERATFLAGLDRQVVAFPTHYAAAPQELAATTERALLMAMLRRSGLAVTGSLPLLVWLAGEADFAAALAGGPETLLPFLAAHGADRPFLVQVDLS